MKNKEATKRKLLNAVGVIIRRDGFAGLGVNKVARMSRVSKILIYRYFGGFNQLIAAYIKEKDFWINYSDDHLDLDNILFSMRENLYKILAEHFNLFYDHCEMEALLLNEMLNHSEIAKNIADDRLMNRSLSSFKYENSSEYLTYVNVIATLLAAGTDHLIFGSEKITTSSKEGDDSNRKKELIRSMGQIVDWTFG